MDIVRINLAILLVVNDGVLGLTQTVFAQRCQGTQQGCADFGVLYDAEACAIDLRKTFKIIASPQNLLQIVKCDALCRIERKRTSEILFGLVVFLQYVIAVASHIGEFGRRIFGWRLLCQYFRNLHDFMDAPFLLQQHPIVFIQQALFDAFVKSGFQHVDGCRSIVAFQRQIQCAHQRDFHALLGNGRRVVQLA